MKRILAIVLVLVCALGAAMAEPAASSGWKVIVDGIAVEKDGESVALNPALELMLGMDGAQLWTQISVTSEGASVLGVQAEYGENVISASADGANDCLVIPDAGLFLEQYGLSTEEVDQLAMVLELLEDEVQTQSLMGLLEQSGVATLTGENSFSVDMEIPDTGVTVRMNVRWEKIEGGKPFDLTGKNACRYTYREMFPGDGTDIPDALTNAAMQLAGEESVLATMALLGAGAIAM